MDPMDIEFESHPFWDYSLDIYGRDGVSAALITFQDRHNLDVNILLLCLWSGQSGRGEMDNADFDHVLSVSANWNPDIVCAIRAVRIRLRDEIASVPKDFSDSVRQKLLELEIDCEHVEQLSFAAGLGKTENKGGSSEERLRESGVNLKSYFDRKGCVPDADDRRELATILSAAFGDIGSEKIRSICDEMFA